MMNFNFSMKIFFFQYFSKTIQIAKKIESGSLVEISNFALKICFLFASKDKDVVRLKQ